MFSDIGCAQKCQYLHQRTLMGLYKKRCKAILMIEKWNAKNYTHVEIEEIEIKTVYQ